MKFLPEPYVRFASKDKLKYEKQCGDDSKPLYNGAMDDEKRITNIEF